ncbi:ABC transporter ATP-binding protein [Thermaerobacter subterraneus]|uniref:Amino acid/amide ABC transporter ATP-binding protein 2, HAAT family n=1 Tax=Thermaerobacter subterraneus DSM 13965 TaxID=867903 RepID=K6Q276_9FIRM|nr:ABC transporter ATP-binding protein [Thermaerobacter subterraneus]EKP95303.1 amino acid/amide ABC transporter ATP-binding protein 2, HAAT family [Thermaerobacter subterraneus DSM 13965]
MLELKDVHVSYGSVRALEGISLQVGSGELVALLGPNGAGKSTTLRAISRLVPLRRGAIVLDGAVPLHRDPPEGVVRRGVVHVPEGRQIFPELTVEENLWTGAFTRRHRAEIRQDLEAVYQRFPRLKERRHQLGGTLSGGEQQMLAIGRALMARPRLLLLDEPSMGLSPRLVEEVFTIIGDLHREGVSILLVEQNAHIALQVAGRAYVLENGRVVLSAPARELRSREEVWSAYTGLRA